MATRRRKRRTLKTRTPARVKKARTKRSKRPKGHQHPELIGLGLTAFGLFLATVVYLGWNGGSVGSWIVDAFRAVIGEAVYALPISLVTVGVLMLVRSSVVELRPFRTGMTVSALGLMITLGNHGGSIGGALAGALAAMLGETGATLVGVTLLIAGAVLLSGASVGAILRSSGHAMRQTARAAKRSLDRIAEADAGPPEIISTAQPARPPVDGAAEFPDVVGQAEPAALIPFPTEENVLPKEPDDEPSVFDATPPAKDYRLPDRNLLRTGTSNGTPGEGSSQVAHALTQALADFGVQATVIGQIVGPRVTRYELQLAPGTKMSKVAALKDDLSYALATTEIRILAPIPGKQAVGVEVPNLSPNLVTLGDVYDDLPQTASPLAVWLGKDISGNAVWTDLARMPHILIAGTTGSGKSGCINTVLTSTLLRATPDDVRMILIDPKRIELSYYESIPHLLTPVVSSPKEASIVLANVLAEMDRRYERLSQARARNLPEANRTFRQRGEETLPYLLVVIDELADLMMISPQQVEDAVIRLAQKSRAVGIHLVLATQRPSVDVITGMIKANVPSRIAFAVSSQTDSRVIIDQGGAESLLGQGDMLFKPLGTSRLQRLQGAYVSEEEIALVVEQCRSQRGQDLDESLLEAPETPFEGDGDEELDFD
ncbi:MAG TPA: DNA translocase FtsK 4TM domain-containing protein, partial [Gaiellaceae bacterium]|nr:DNA translocase FtsK 4TM domain-containing protein [Gaiellaceae bacterium]